MRRNIENCSVGEMQVSLMQKRASVSALIEGPRVMPEIKQVRRCVVFAQSEPVRQSYSLINMQRMVLPDMFTRVRGLARQTASSIGGA